MKYDINEIRYTSRIQRRWIDGPGPINQITSHPIHRRGHWMRHRVHVPTPRRVSPLDERLAGSSSRASKPARSEEQDGASQRLRLDGLLRILVMQ